jgi:hypothetical protein
VGEIEIKWIYDVFNPVEVYVQLDQFVQLDSLNIDGVFEIRELGFAYRVSQASRHDKIYNLISEKVIEARSESFEGRMETGGKFKYEGTGECSRDIDGSKWCGSKD